MVVHEKILKNETSKVKKSIFSMKDRFYIKYSQRLHQLAHIKET